MKNKTIKHTVSLCLVILVPVLLFAGAYGFVWWKVSEFADDFARDISPYADMKYQDIYIDLFQSEVGLRGMSFIPAGMKGEIGIDATTLKAPSWGFILSLDEQLSKGELPESFNIDISGIDLNLQSGYMQDWGRMAADAQHHVGPSYDTLACGDRHFFSIADIRKMGYSRIRSDLSIQYAFDKVDKQLNFDLQSKTAQMADASISLNVGVTSDTLNMQTIAFAQPQLKRIKTRFYDRGYNVRKNKFCAALNKEPVQDYRQRYAEMLSKRLDYEGWTVPKHLFDAIDGLNNPGGSFYLRVDIPQGFGMQSMALIQQPTDLLDALNPYMEFNGKAVSWEGVAWSEPDPEGERLLHELNMGAEEVSEIEQVPSVLPEEDAEHFDMSIAMPSPVYERRNQHALKRLKQQKNEKTFKPVELSNLEPHLGEPVILYTYFGRKVEGRLIDVNPDVITVEHRLVDGRGTATYPISRDKIQSARLYY
ncbi:hypothetical protein [Neptuniibacter marinus]|uniref:hypothetical protein n=1 Tax=Neptuniibacter marinus TaxID=1806670 RepID=UPI003B5AC135